MTSLRFEKWEGLGNDFVLIDEAIARDLFAAAALPVEVTRRICDRRRGVGADGVLLAAVRRDGAGSMIVFNADGSRPEMCGNGLRCVAGWLARAHARPAGAEAHGPFVVATDAGLRRCQVAECADGTVDVEIAMGRVALGPPLCLDVGDRRVELATADVGNPHAVTFEAFDDGAFDPIASRLARAPVGGINVELCRVIGASPAVERLDVVVWERGVGRTQSCGTGACAATAVACARGLCAYGVPITVRLPGGDLRVTIAKATAEATLRGPARRVFAGEIELG